MFSIKYFIRSLQFRPSWQHLHFYKNIFIFFLLMMLHEAFSLDYGNNFYQENAAKKLIQYEKLVAEQPNNVDYLLVLGHLYEDLGRQKEAVKIYKRALELAPEKQELRVRLAYSYLKDKDYTSSQELFQAVLTKEPNNVDALLGLGLVAVNHKHFPQAANYFRKVLSKDPQNFSALLKLADLLLQQNHDIEALEFYKKAAALPPSNQQSQIELNWIEEKSTLAKAKILTQQKSFEKALILYNKLLMTSPDNADYLLASGYLHENLGHISQAIDFYKRALKLESEKHQEIQVRLAYSYLKDKDFTSSNELFQAVLLKKPDNIDALLGLAQVETMLKHLAEAELYLKRVLKLDPRNASALLYLSDLLMLKNQDNEACELCKKALSFEPDNQRAQKVLKQLLEKYLIQEAKLLAHQKSYQKAIKIYEQLIRLSPKNTDYYLLLGNSYLRIKRYLKAIEIFEEALNIKPNSELKEALAFAYLRNGTQAPLLWTHYQWFIFYPYLFYFIPENIYPRVNWKSIEISQSLFQDVLDQNPHDADALAGLGRIKALKDNKEQAECLYRKALEIQPENTTALAYYAALLASEGRYFSSRDAYEKLIQLDPSDKNIRQDYIDQVNRSDPIYSLLGFYSEENEQDQITPTKKDWTARLKNYGGGFSCSFAVRDRMKLFGLVSNEYFILNNLINKTTIYSLDVTRFNIGFSWNYNPYINVMGGCGFSSFKQHLKSTFFTKSGIHIQPFLTLTYSRNHHTCLVETTSDAPLVARNFTALKATLIDRQFLRGFYEYDFGNRTLIGTTAANIWYINRIKANQQQLATTWFQWGPPIIWQYLVLRYQFIYSRFNKLTSDYSTFRFQTTHWLTVTFSKNWWNNRLVTEAGYGYGWQRGFEQGQIIVINPVSPFHVVNREINAAYARLECRPTDYIDFALTGKYTLDSFNYTTASVTGRFSWRF